jgi:lipid A 3-O-deacylase
LLALLIANLSSRSIVSLLGWGLGLTLASVAQADALRLDVGYGQGVELYAIALQLDRSSPVHRYDIWTLTTRVDFGISDFEGQHSDSHGQSTRALSAVGKLRWQREAATALRPFFEVGLGLGGFSQTTIAGVRHLGGGFEFTEVLRSGVRFGQRGQFEVALLGQHFSNAGLNRPNEGITYAGASIAWYFR